MKAAYKSIRTRCASVAVIGLCLAASSLHGQLITLDPDAYPDNTVLNTVIPGLNLITVGTDNLPYQPRSFDVTAVTQTFPYQPPTGVKVFAHVGIPFWNDIRRLRMDFSGLVSTISIDFMGSSSLVAERGQLEVYGLGGQLLGTYTSASLFGGQVETLGIQRDQADIAWAVAYTLPGNSVFGALDHLVFSQPVAVPEPRTIALLLMLGAVALVGRRCRP
jgi:hypothetical protein